MSFFSCSFISAQSVQDVRITEDFSNQPLADALSKLQAKYGLRFGYADEAVAEVVVNCRFQSATWPEVADCLFARNGLEATLLDDGYVTLRAGAPRDWNICLQTQSMSGEVLPFVTLGNPTLGLSYATGADGFLQTTCRAKATDSLSVHYLGYATTKVSPNQLLAREGCYVIALQATSIELASVTVKEYLTEGISATEDGRRVLLDPEAVVATPGFADREVFRTLPLLPGITNLQETASSLSIRGGTPDQNLILWDNIPIYASGHYLNMVSSFSPELIGSVDVWRGRAEAEFGGHVSGVIRMTTDREISKKIALGGGVSLLQANAYAHLPVVAGKSDLKMAYRGSLPNLLAWPAYNSYRSQALQGFRVGTILRDDQETTDATETFTFGELNGRWQFNLAPGHELTLSGFWQRDDLNYDFSVSQADQLPNTDALESTNQGASLHYAHTGSAGHKTEGWLTVTNFDNLGENEYNREFVDFLVLRQSSIQELSAKVVHSRKVGARTRVQGGVQGQRYYHDFVLSAENRRTGRLREASVRDGVATVLAPFATYDWASSQGLQAQLGLRLPWYGPTDQLYFEPRLNASYRLTDNWLIKGGYGRNHQFPLQVIELNQVNVSGAATIWTLANGREFPVQAAHEFSVGISGQPKSWFFDLELYHKRVDGLAATSLNLEVDTFATGSSRAIGADLLIRKRWGNWRTWLVYSLSKTEWDFPLVSEEGFFPADLDRRHQLRLVQTYSNGRWTLSAGWQLQSGAPFSTTRAELNRDDGSTFGWQLVQEDINDKRLSLYHRADFSVAYEWSPAKARDWTGGITFSLINLYNRDNVLERNFIRARNEDRQPGELGVIASPVDRLGLGLTPNVSVRVGWR
ncbi:MAG: TonB-dependent receptor [Bacteroidota bacterium]